MFRSPLCFTKHICSFVLFRFIKDVPFSSNLSFQGHCNPIALSSLSHLFVRQISQIRLVTSSTNLRLNNNKSECEERKRFKRNFCRSWSRAGTVPSFPRLAAPPKTFSPSTSSTREAIQRRGKYLLRRLLCLMSEPLPADAAEPTQCL